MHICQNASLQKCLFNLIYIFLFYDPFEIYGKSTYEKHDYLIKRYIIMNSILMSFVTYPK